MSTIIAGQSTTVFLESNREMTVTVSSDGSGSVTRLGDKSGDQPQGPATALAASAKRIFGPLQTTTFYKIVCDAGTITYAATYADLSGLTSTPASCAR